MQTAERPAPSEQLSASASRELGRALAWPALGAILAVGLALRLWGIGEGLPYVYNIDEIDHFVPRAVHMFADGTLNPHYFANPPGFTYLLHWIFWVAYGGGAQVVHHFARHPAEVYELARVVSALLGTLALWLLYLTGARLFGRAAGLLAAAIEAVAFLPVFYGHLALNDAPTLAPLTASLLGSAGILRNGRMREYALAGAGLGLAAATKYTAGIALLALLAAAAVRLIDMRSADSGERAGARALGGGLLLAGALALVAFLIANPFSLLDYSSFHTELVHQSTLSAEGQGKLGAPKEAAIVYYLWSLSWGLGWVPSLAALGGAVVVWRRDRRAGLLLVPPALLFLLFMGLQGRFFGRWLMPIFPFACLLAALFALVAVEWAARWLGRRSGANAPADAGHGAHAGLGADAQDGGGSRGGAAAPGAAPAPGRQPHARQRVALLALWTVLAALLLAQGAVYSIHSGLVLSREDTRASTRAWLLAHVPRGRPIVSEPVSLAEWDRGAGPGGEQGTGAQLWIKYPSLLPRVDAAGRLESRPSRRPVGIEDYETTLAPALLGYYTAHGYCFLITASTEAGRALADPRAVPRAIAYYRALEQQGERVFEASPYSAGAHPVAFNFDWSLDYYPLAYARPGPLMTVYRLHGGRCGRAGRT